MSVTYPRAVADVTPDKPAAVMYPSGETLSYAALEAQANQVANLFRDMGIKAGDKVAFKLRNCLDVFPFAWGAQRAGVIYVSISNSLTYDEMAFIVEDSDAKLLLSSVADNPDMAEQIAANFPNVHLFDTVQASPGWGGWKEAIAGYPTDPIADESYGADMMYSSGTTGRPKGIVTIGFEPEKPVEDWPIMATLASKLCGMNSETVYLCPAPIYHAAPLRWCAAVQFLGGTTILMERFKAEHVLDAIQKHRVTLAQFVPTHFNRLLDLPEETKKAFDLSSLENVAHAAAPCPVEIKQQMIDWWGPILTEYYSGSEGAGFTFINTEEWVAHPGSVGRSILGTIRICDDNDDEVETGVDGFVYFDNDRQFRYHNDDKKTAESRNKHGWSTMGDIGRLDEDGYLYLTGRASFTIVSGGVNIYPQEIENHLINHPLVRDVAVIGTPCKDLGEKVTAVIELYDHDKAGDDVVETLVAFTREKLSGIKVPKEFLFNDALPRTETGKLLKKKLRAEFWPPNSTL